MPNPEFYSRIRAGPMTPRRCEIGRRGVQEIEHHPCHQHDDGYHRAAGPGKFFAPNLWPQSVPGMRPVWEAYYREMERVATTLMRIFAVGLGMDIRYFDDKVDRHITNFSVLQYSEQLKTAVAAALRQDRVGRTRLDEDQQTPHT
jgi:isopenicillin N synthase-like dioxygenase